MNDVSGGFGGLLRAGRRAAGLSQRHLADRAGISLAAIRDLEQGRTRRPQRRFVDAIAAALTLDETAETALRRAAEPGDRDPPGAPADAGGPVRIRVLGPLAVHRDTADVPVGRGGRRAVLARLALSANAPAPMTDLVEMLGDARSPVRAVQTYLSRLRSALRPAALSRTPGGYRLDLGDDQLDLAEFRRLTRLSRSARPAEAVELLAAALALWQGDPLSDIPQLHGHPLLVALGDERIAAALRYAELALRGGRAEACLPLLRELAIANPLHEPLHACLITVLAAGDLQAAALNAYASIRHRLAAELGIQPGPELLAAHRRALRPQPPPETGASGAVAPVRAGGSPPPAQLPADIPQFTGRLAAMARLDGILDAHLAGSAVAITAVSGPAGVGKTALAVHWAHRVRARFPDGQLHADLRGHHPAAPRAPVEVLHGFLTALGVPAAGIPAGADTRSALLRTLLAGRRVLLLLDNARDAEQIRPLLPGAPGCHVLITSRHTLASLIAGQGAHLVPLDVLTQDESRDLLAHRLGRWRTAAEPDAADMIVERCARLPLALAIAAARAVTRPNASLADLVMRLGDGRARLAALTTGDPDTDVRAAFSWSYRELSAPAARLFRLLGLQPAADLAAPAAARLAGLPVPETLALLAELTDAHLVAEAAPGRYTFHGLLRAYAADRAAEEETPAAVRACLTRLFDHYLHAARAAAHLLFPTGPRPRRRPDPDPSGPAFDGAVAARAWLDTERANLVAVAGHAAAHGWPGHTTALASAVRRCSGSGDRDGLLPHAHAYAAARRQGDHAAEARALTGPGLAAHRPGDPGTPAGQHRTARVTDGPGAALLAAGDIGTAQAGYAAALALADRAGDRHGQADAHNGLAHTHRAEGDTEKARHHWQQALTIYADIGISIATALSLM
ncbi:BTAD domain-containing putative transcriptional regulator [Dactylosporangium sp. NPDC005555]|uniref:BTAD domain-containing putative transcriptional regulator n=1 Tax=Dactylosporangium sp. NPDC005555 TaxID=3154889 RepID=UPI0033B12482